MDSDRTVRITVRLDAFDLVSEVWFDLYDSAEVSHDTLVGSWSVQHPMLDLPIGSPMALEDLHRYACSRYPRLV